MDYFGRELIDNGGLPSVLGPVSVMEDLVDELLVLTKAVVAQMLQTGSVGPGGSTFGRVSPALQSRPGAVQGSGGLTSSEAAKSDIVPVLLPSYQRRKPTRRAALAPSSYDITNRRHGEDTWLAGVCGVKKGRWRRRDLDSLQPLVSVDGLECRGTMRGVGEGRQRESSEWWGLC